ncbi:hypothetical protein DQF64_09525 [Moraxella bovis]|nr:hypothetical protein DQF64_09525 [Moraxella bovis]
MAIRPLNLKNQVKTLKIYPVKWSDCGSKSKARLIERLSAYVFFLKNVRFFVIFIANTKGRHALIFESENVGWVISILNTNNVIGKI